MKDKAPCLLIVMVTKRNDVLKTRGCANISLYRVCTSKNDCSLHTPAYFYFKSTYAVIPKGSEETASVHLLGLFLKTERDGENLILLKLIDAIALLLVESDGSK